jgi:hypothetical protein
MIHLTEMGMFAGRRLCLSTVYALDDGSVHAAYAPLDGNPEYRARCCPQCLKVWADEAYDVGDDMPAWVVDMRNK